MPSKNRRVAHQTQSQSVQSCLHIRELHRLILSFLDWKCNIKNAQVCKEWSEVALELSWAKVDTLGRLLNMICPIEKKKDGSYRGDYVSFFMWIYPLSSLYRTEVPKMSKSW